jgi:catechol 2,3-dioxygenase-like lactoylglutathione lyase family enzyme
MDWKLELVAILVSDVDRAKAFYTEKAGFNADHDHRVSDEIRFVQLTPPGSACSIALGAGIVDTPPGSVQGLQLVVADINAARAELVDRGVEASEVQEFPWGARSSSSAIPTAMAGPYSNCQLATSPRVSGTRAPSATWTSPVPVRHR